jgi:predicted hydrocarbon binding protein
MNIRSVVEVGHAVDSLVALPPAEKFAKSLEFFTIGSGKGAVAANGKTGMADLDVSDCLLCDGRTSERPVCSLYEGVMQYLADWAYGKGVYLPRETMCIAKGDARCYFELQEKTGA